MYSVKMLCCGALASSRLVVRRLKRRTPLSTASSNSICDIVVCVRLR